MECYYRKCALNRRGSYLSYLTKDEVIALPLKPRIMVSQMFKQFFKLLNPELSSLVVTLQPMGYDLRDRSAQQS